MGFTLGYEALIEIDQRLVPPESCRQCSRIEGRAHGIAAAGDVASSSECGGIPVERRKSCQACRLLAREGAKLRHADDQRQRGAWSDAGDGQDQFETTAQV